MESVDQADPSDIPRPPLPTPTSAPAAPTPEPSRGAGRLAIVALVAIALAVMSVTTEVASKGNPNDGAVKIHDDAVMDPPTQDNPHVDCGSFWVEGFDMEDEFGHISIRSWQPTGDGSTVVDDGWTADGATLGNHFLNGPYTLEAGHYRLDVSNGEVEPGQMKMKMFWVDPCDEPEPTTSSSSSSSSSPPSSSSSSSASSSGPSSSSSSSTGPGPEPEPELACPTNLVATPLGDGSIRLRFSPAPGSDGTNIYRSDGGAMVYVTTVGDGIDEWIDGTTEAGEGHSYTVTGLYGDAESTDCPVVETTAIPEFPTVVGLGLATLGGVLAIVLAGRKP